MKRFEVVDLQNLLGEILVAMAARGGVSVWSPGRDRPLAAGEIHEACRGGRPLRLGMLDGADVERIREMACHVEMFHRGVLNGYELLLLLKRQWDRLDSLAADWMDPLHRQLCALRQVVYGPNPRWTHDGWREILGGTLSRIEALPGAPYADAA